MKSTIIAIFAAFLIPTGVNVPSLTGCNKSLPDSLLKEDDIYEYTFSGFKKATDYFEQLAVLTDSLKVREQQSAVIELSMVYETNEKEALIKEQATCMKIRTILLLSAVGGIFLLLALWWRSIRHNRTIRCKNQKMISTIEELLGYKDELCEKRQELHLLKEEKRLSEQSDQKKTIVQKVDFIEEKTDVMNEENRMLFERLESIILQEMLFLNPELSREDLMKVLHIGKNRFGQIIQHYAGTNVTAYINAKRLEYATKLLKIHTDYTVTSIAAMCGIPNAQTFHRLFRTKFGMTPAEFRDGLKTTEKNDDMHIEGQSETTL